jgi:hypothetical protein
MQRKYYFLSYSIEVCLMYQKMHIFTDEAGDKYTPVKPSLPLRPQAHSSAPRYSEFAG